MKYSFLFICLNIISPLLWAQQNLVTDNSFNPLITDGASNYIIRTMALQSDNKIIIGGQFDSYNGVNSRGIVRLNPDGSVDNTFISGTGIGSFGEVRSIVIQDDGKILVGGTFFSYNGTDTYGVIRLLSNGMLDPTFVLGTNDIPFVTSILVLPNHKILVSGTFFTYLGESYNSLVCLNEDGSIDHSFHIGTGLQTLNTNIPQAYAMAYDHVSNKIVLVGFFSGYDGYTSNNIVRINMDGTIDAGFSIGIGFDDIVFSLKVQNDGKYIVGGYFYNYNSKTVKYLARLNNDGVLDTSFDTGISFNFPIHTMVLQPDGKLIVGGQFTKYNNYNAYNLARLLSDGSFDPSFYNGPGANDNVYSILLQPDSKVLVAGGFTSFDTSWKKRITRLESSSVTTGIQQNLIVEAVVFPNPIQNTFYIQTVIEYEEIQVMRSDGVLLKYFNKSPFYDLSDWENGLYFIHLLNSNKKIVGMVKILVNK